MRTPKFTHRTGSSDHTRLCLRPGCGLSRKRGIPVCGPDWRKVPLDLKERLAAARGHVGHLEDTEAPSELESQDMEYIAAMHAIVQWFDEQVG